MKIVIILLSLFILTGCNNENIKDKEYHSYVNMLKESTEFDSELPFDISIYLKKLNDDEVTYKVIIDNPKKELKSIEAIIIHDNKTNDIYPSIGIYDDKVSLIPNKVDKDNNIVKGIILTGYIPYSDDINNLKVSFKLLFKYTDSEGEHTIIYSTKKIIKSLYN